MSMRILAAPALMLAGTLAAALPASADIVADQSRIKPFAFCLLKQHDRLKPALIWDFRATTVHSQADQSIRPNGQW